MATASTDNNRRPHPTITYPSVHLDSFSPDRFNTGAFPAPAANSTASTSTTTAPPAQAGPSRLPLSRQIGEAGSRDEAAGLQPPSSGLYTASPASMSQQLLHQRPSSSGSGSSNGRPRLAVQQKQPAGDGLTAAPGSGSGQSYGTSSTSMQQASSSMISTTLTRPPPPTLPPPNLGLPPLPSLSPISPMYDLPADGTSHSNAPESPFPTTSISSPAGPRPQGARLGPSLSIHIPKSPQQTRSVPSLKDSPGIPRRRTIVENEGHQGILLDVESSRNHSKETPRRLEKKASTNDLRQLQPGSPSSPTARRLPRPPGEIALPTASTTWPVPNTPKAFTPQHQPQKSASILPVVGGLADAGPYPSTTTPRQQPGVGTSTGIGMGRPPVAKPVGKPQEEICLECMMRDRDLADVTVTGPGAWARQSDADWDELRWREEALLKSMGSQCSLSIPSLEDGDASSDSEDTSVSVPSTGNSAEDSENRRRLAAKKQQRSALRARRREADGRVAREVGWRGFKWEEGKQGEGMPRGFRGTVGGRLTEGGIKAVMTKYPKASEHRYEYLHKYLAHQWKLVIDIRSEAQRRGHFAVPGELSYTDSVSSHEPSAAGPRNSSISWDQRSALELRETIREPLTPAIVRPSPSTPTELAALRPKPAAVSVPRPHTQLLPETAAERYTPTPHSARSRYEKGVSSPGTLERSPQPDRWAEDEDALWSPVSAGDGSLRPFSFAVRAGAAAARDGVEGGGGRKSLWGRWGGSVTSFFGGSQGGSGSMMDMHLGLDNDRRNAPSHQVHHNYSRAVSMASPSRPSFFSGNSRTSVDQTRDPRALSKSISSSRLSQVVKTDDDAAPKKKKGFKGLIQKMKPKAKRQSSSSMPPVEGQRQPYRQTPDPSDAGTPLAPPPNMAFLAGQGQQRHHRNGSSSSMADSQGSSWKMRSVSAPIGGSSSGSLSASPTSSKFRRESYNSGQQRGPSGDYDGELQRGSIVEVLNGAGGQHQGNNGAYRRGSYASPEQVHAQIYDDHRGFPGGPGPAAAAAAAQSQPQAYPHPSFRGSRHTAGSISNSSGIAPTIETPPMPLNQTPFFSRPPSINSPATATSNNFASPNPNVNRFKNLPPLPPADPDRDRERDRDRFASSSRESFQVLEPHLQPATPDFTRSPTKGYAYQHQNPHQHQTQTPPPRVSYDRPTSTPRAEASPRMAQSMYVQPTASGSAGAFHRFGPQPGVAIGAGAYRPPSHNDMYGQPPYPGPDRGPRSNGFVEQDKKSLISKKGIKGFFGGAKSGRMA